MHFDTPRVNHLQVRCNLIWLIEVDLRSYQRNHKIPISVSAQNQPIRVKSRPKNAKMLYFFPRLLFSRLYSHNFISPDTIATVSFTRQHNQTPNPVSDHQTPQPRFHIASNQSHDSMSPTAKAKVSCTRQHSHDFIHQTSKHCFISPDATAMVSFTSWFHLQDTRATVSFMSRSFTRRHSRGFVHQTPQPLVSFIRYDSCGFIHQQKAQDY